MMATVETTKKGGSLTHKVINQGYYWHVQQRQGLCEKVSTMSKVCSSITQTEYRPPYLTQPLAFYAMGIGCGRAASRAQPQLWFLLV